MINNELLITRQTNRYKSEAKKDLERKKQGQLLAGGPGFEPGLTGPEPVVLPLNYLPTSLKLYAILEIFPMSFENFFARIAIVAIGWSLGGISEESPGFVVSKVPDNVRR